MLNVSNILLKFISLILGISEMQSFPPPLSVAEEEELFEKRKKVARVQEQSLSSIICDSFPT